MKVKMAIAVFSALALLFAGIPGQARAGQAGDSSAAPSQPCLPNEGCVPMFSTQNLGRMGDFYVGGKWQGEPGKEIMYGATFVEVLVPKKIQHPYPVVFVQGGGGQNLVAALQTPDGRQGWAVNFLNAGYTVYMIDSPGTGRSAYFPGLYPALTPPHAAKQMEQEWTGGLPPSPQAQKVWPQWSKDTEWPSSSPNKGKVGDPVFDYYAETELHYIAGYQEKLFSQDIIQLLDLIGKPVIMLVNSGFAPSGWVAADARPKLVKAIIAPEPWAPPVENEELGLTGQGRLWGLSNLPLHYYPPITNPEELYPVRQASAPGPGLVPCMLQAEPAHKLINLKHIPVLNVSGEASYHRPYARCVADWLNQAGVKTTYVRLEDVGLLGNGHQMMSEKNSASIAKFFMQWLDKNIH
jgi:pimeloyl-ACP methyl ester carboxylesterase